MTCDNCEKEFNPHTNAELGNHDEDAVEVKTACPHCDKKYYTFTQGWTPETE